MNQNLDQFGFLLHFAARRMRKRFDQRVAQMGLSSAQWRLMVNVSRLGQSTQARLADVLEIEPISVSRLIDRMEAAGWVRREADPQDRRVKLIFPTPKALAAYAEIKLLANDVYGEALDGVCDADRAILLAGLNTIISNLSADGCGTDLPLAKATP